MEGPQDHMAGPQDHMAGTQDHMARPPDHMAGPQDHMTTPYRTIWQDQHGPTREYCNGSLINALFSHIGYK